MEAYIGEIKMFTGSYAPKGWALCQGQRLPITDHQALYSLLGSNFGGDDRTYFNLPDFRGRTPVGFGSNDLLDIALHIGQTMGTETQSLNVKQIPVHTHAVTTSGAITATLNASADGATAEGPNNKFLAQTAGNTYLNNISNAKKMNSGAIAVDTSNLGVTIGSTGQGKAFGITQPSLTVNYIISLDGLYPPRN